MNSIIYIVKKSGPVDLALSFTTFPFLNFSFPILLHLLATLVLLIELNLIVSSAWKDFDMQTQWIIFGATLVIVLTFGFTRIGPAGFIKRRKRR